MIKWISERTLGVTTNPCTSVYDCALCYDCMNGYCTELNNPITPAPKNPPIDWCWWDRCLKTGGNPPSCIEQWNKLNTSPYIVPPLYRICKSSADCLGGMLCIDGKCVSGIPSNAPAPGSVQVPPTIITCDKDTDCPSGMSCQNRTCTASSAPIPPTPTTIITCDKDTDCPSGMSCKNRSCLPRVVTKHTNIPLIIGSIAALAIIGIVVAAS